MKIYLAFGNSLKPIWPNILEKRDPRFYGIAIGWLFFGFVRFEKNKREIL